MGTFLVTSHGRSGTKWLARELNRSKTWTVTHEGTGAHSVIKNYGNVSSYMRFYPPEVDKLAVIVRDPMGIARSAYYKNPQGWKQFIKDLPKDLQALEDLLERPDTIRIHFPFMVLNESYLVLIAQSLGITDLDERSVDLSATNSSKPGGLSSSQEEQVERAAGWFRRKWCLPL